jgi:hypothetical protein
MRSIVLFAGALLACLALPTAASAARHCCFELAVKNEAHYTVDYLNDGFGYDGSYDYRQIWQIHAIIGYSDRGDGTLRNRGARSRLGFGEYSTVTTCQSGSPPCFNRAPIACSGATYQPPSGGYPGYYENGGITASERGGGASIGRGSGETWLYALPPDDVYYAIKRVGCDGGHGHHGYGKKAEEFPGVGERSVSLNPPDRQFMKTAGEGDRCSYTFKSSLTLPVNHSGSQTPGGHTWTSDIAVSYKLSYFPKKRLDEERDKLADLGNEFAFPSQTNWGTKGTGNRTC